MPHHKSCKKRLLTSRKSRLSNRQNRSLMRGRIKDFRTQVESGAEKDPQALSQMYSLLDVQARKGIIPKKRASRLKSRLAAAAAAK